MSSQLNTMSCFCHNPNSKHVSYQASPPSCSLSAFYHSSYHTSSYHPYFPYQYLFQVSDGILSHSNGVVFVFTGRDSPAQEECGSAVFPSNAGVFIQCAPSPHRKRQCEFATNGDSLSNLSFDIWSRHW